MGIKRKSMLQFKLISIWLLAIVFCTNATAQNTVSNYHMCDNPGVSVEDGHPTFNGNPGNWERSHGSPNWGISYLSMISNNPKTGEGVFQNNVFPNVGYYKIRIGISSWVKTSRKSKIKVLATSGLHQTGTDKAQTKPPTPTISAHIGEYTGPSRDDFEWVVEEQFLNAFSAHQLWIFVESDFADAYTKAVIDYVIVCPVSGPGAIYATGYIPYGTTSSRSFNIGSSFGGSGTVSNYWGMQTELVAENSINISPITSIIISPNTGGTFLAKIGGPIYTCPNASNNCNIASYAYSTSIDSLNRSCEDIDSNLVDSTLLAANANNDQETINIIYEYLDGYNCESFTSMQKYTSSSSYNPRAKRTIYTSISVHPNPTTGSFTIQLPIAEDCEVRITNIMGATVYQSSMKGEQKKQIQLDGGLPAGNYTLQLRGKTINHIEKLVLTK